ncbi:MAG: peroxiredoxin family protein [Desulfovibrionaceae bacterium]
MRRAIILAALFSLMAACAAGAAWAEPVAGSGTVPSGLALSAPLGPDDAGYLGIGPDASFTLSDVKAPYLIVEVLGLYCPLCHTQAPLFDKFFTRLTTDPAMSSKVKMLGMAAGATKEEMAYLLESGVYKYPIAWDPDYVAHKALGEPKTPYTMLLDANGKVLYDHLGVIEDVNAFYGEIAKLVR